MPGKVIRRKLYRTIKDGSVSTIEKYLTRQVKFALILPNNNKIINIFISI